MPTITASAVLYGFDLGDRLDPGRYGWSSRFGDHAVEPCSLEGLEPLARLGVERARREPKPFASFSS